LSNKKPFTNYTSTLLSAPGFNPSPHSKTLFLENFHANSYLAGGIKGILKLNQQMHFRLEGYGFMPFHELVKNTDNKATKRSELVKNIYYQALAALVYDTGVGPASLVLNYYDKPDTRWYFTLNFGYVLFNKRGF